MVCISHRRVAIQTAEDSTCQFLSIVIGKAEGGQTDWHGHVTAITVAPEYRRLGLARRMMERLERVSDGIYHGFFVDLFVRPSNRPAIMMYEGMGYSVFRRIKNYYEGADGFKEEDGFGACLCSPFRIRGSVLTLYRHEKTSF